jgi:hypothetical protein
MALAGIVKIAKADSVEKRYRPGPHGEDIPENATYPGCSTLDRFHRAGVIVGLDLETTEQVPTQVDHASVLPRALDHPRSLDRQLPQ